jgi:hypothetical protein
VSDNENLMALLTYNGEPNSGEQTNDPIGVCALAEGDDDDEGDM